MTASKPPVQAALDALNKSRVMMKFHVKGGACIEINGKITNATDLYQAMQKAHADLQKWVDDVPDGKDSTTGHLGHIHNLAKHLLKGVSDE